MKFLPHHLGADDEEKKRFIREAKAASALDHPNICTIYEIDETEDGRMFIAMAYYEGETLKKKIERGPLPLDEAINFAIQAAQGLQCAHEAGITHRDIKPANIMITTRGEVKIVDFGLAKLAGRTKLTKEGMTLGTVAYMSPEQARGEEVDHRTDVWSLGVVLYEMICGRLPFRGEYEAALMYSLMNEEPEPITGLRTGVPMELERIVNKSLAKNPGERYQHVDEILVDLRLIQRDFASGASKQRLTEVKFSKKRRFYLYGSVATLLIFLIGIVFFRGARETHARHDSIAVLPLANLSGDPDQEYFADGMTESLITDLAQISALKVISRTSVMQYKEAKKPLPEIAKELKVDVVLEGSVLRFGERVRITAQLIEATTDRHLWAKSYEHDLRNVLTLQSEVAQAIVQEIRLKLTPQEQVRLMSLRTVTPEAYQSYLKGRYYWNKRTEDRLKKGIEYFQQAIAIDSSYAPAYAGLADCYFLLSQYAGLPPKEAFPKAKAAAMKALDIDDTLAEAHISLASVLQNYEWNWLAAEKEFRRAIELNPNYATAHHFYSFYLTCVGRTAESLAEIKKAQELDPLSLIINTDVGAIFYYARQYDQAIEQCQKTLEVEPTFSLAHTFIGLAYLQKSKYEEAILAFQKVRRYPFAVPMLGYTYAVSGKRSEAMKILEELLELSKRRHVSTIFIAAIYIGLGQRDQAFEWLEKACEERAFLLGRLKSEPLADNLRSDPRFIVLLRRIGLEK